MSITVRQLLEIPHLRTRVLAGAGGLDRPLTWAHACEEADPTPWLNGGELVMTTGLAIPEDPAEQAAYLRRLDLADTGAVTLGEQLHAPPISEAMLRCADELGLPLLSTAYEVPFIAVARAVVEGNLREEHARFVRTQRVYDVVRQSAVEDAPAATMLDRLAGLAGAAAWFVELPDASAPFDGAAAPPAELRDRLLAAVARRDGPLPAVMRLDAADGAPVLAITVAASRPGVLLAVGREGKPDTPLLQHVATVAAVEFEKVLGARERDG
jgi:purine catabolism regulator